MSILIALLVGLGGGSGIASLIQSLLSRRNERVRVDIDEDKFAQDSLQKIIENLWKDNDILRVSDELKTERIRSLEKKVAELENRLDELMKGV